MLVLMVLYSAIGKKLRNFNTNSMAFFVRKKHFLLSFSAKKEMEVMKKELDDVKDQVFVLKSFDEEGEKRQKVFEKVERVRMIMIFRS